ncbi:MAG TPA: Gfo/Idh/MocA family oxidoreductase [Methylomirabilota bacterium]|nr:Gfo/Idh/MocA family oxidoreductase [Methylomirabilota bacterium]
MEKLPLTRQSRREFIQKTAGAAAIAAAVNQFKTPVYGQNQAPSPGRVLGANDRIVVGFIGVGGQGMAHVRSQKDHAQENNIAIAAVNDVWTKRVENARAHVGGDCKGYADYRQMLDRKDIDAVSVSTVDHWHTKITVDALNTGKHVYVEKPMTRYLDEAFEIEAAVKKTGKILQVGSQGCSDAKWHKAAELIRAGKIGNLVLGQGSYMRNSPKGEWNYNIDPDLTEQNIDWKAWLGPVKKKVPFDKDHYFRWRKYYPYCSGLLGDLFPHRLHPLMLATGAPEFPTRVVAIGTRKVETDKNTPNTYMRDVPENIQCLAEFPSGLTLFVTSSTINERGIEDMIRGHKGTLYMAGNRVRLLPERPFADDIEEEDHTGLKPGEDVAVHEKNWFDSIRANKQPNAGIDLAVKVQTVISLAEMSDRLGIACSFDPKTRKITTGDNKTVKPITYGTLPLS